MALPPWLAPQNFVDAMAKGAQAGLTRRGQNMAAQQHAASLALQRDQLRVAQQQKAVEFAQSEARAAEALRQHNALESYRQQSLAEEQAARQAAAARAQANQQFQMQKEASREAHQALMEKATLRRLDAQDAAAAARDKSQADLERHRLSLEDVAQRRLDLAEGSAASKLTPQQASTQRTLEHEKAQLTAQQALMRNRKFSVDEIAAAKQELGGEVDDNAAARWLRQNAVLSLNAPIKQIQQKLDALHAPPGQPAAAALTPPIGRSTTIAPEGVTPENANAGVQEPNWRTLIAGQEAPDGQPAAEPTNGVMVRRKSDGKTFRYRGNAQDVPADKFDILE